MKYFTIEELCESTTAKKHRIKNVPNEYEKKNLEFLVENLLDPVREYLKKPIYINSGFRSKELNEKVKGSKTSNHNFGYAADCEINGNNIDIARAVLLLGLDFDELIVEKGSLSNPNWIHLALRRDKPNRKKMLFYNGKNYLRINSNSILKGKTKL